MIVRVHSITSGSRRGPDGEWFDDFSSRTVVTTTIPESKGNPSSRIVFQMAAGDVDHVLHVGGTYAITFTPVDVPDGGAR